MGILPGEGSSFEQWVKWGFDMFFPTENRWHVSLTRSDWLKTWFNKFQDGYCTTNQIYYSFDQVLIPNNHYEPLLITSQGQEVQEALQYVDEAIDF